MAAPEKASSFPRVVPFPWPTPLKVVADDPAVQTALDSTLSPGFVSLQGYLSGRLAAAALELAGPHPTRDGLLRPAVMGTGGLEATASACYHPSGGLTADVR